MYHTSFASIVLSTSLRQVFKKKVFLIMFNCGMFPNDNWGTRIHLIILNKLLSNGYYNNLVNDFDTDNVCTWFGACTRCRCLCNQGAPH